MLLIENTEFFPFIPLTSKEFIKESKKIDKSSLAYLSISANTSYQNLLKIKAENLKKRNKNIVLFILFSICLFLIFTYWGIFGWWNLLILPLVILSFLFALAVIHD